MSDTPAAARWRKLVDEHATTGLSATEFAIRRGVKPGTFKWWRSRLKKLDAERSPFTELVVAPVATPVVCVEAPEPTVAMQVRTELLECAFLQGDDTGMPVQDAGNGALRKGRLWAFTDQQQVFYTFTDTKEGKAPVALLEGFAGELLLVDGGSEFNEVVRQQELTRAGCWSHLRKRFFEARHAHPRDAQLALGTIRDLFLLERQLWGRPPDEVLAERQRLAKPLVDGFFAWATATSIGARPESLLGKALGYALNQRATMEQHLEHGEFPMHNNLSELMLRQAVVGRKNWLFARSEGGAEVAATCYTLVGTCQLQGVDPYAYLVDVLGRIQDHPATRLGELTPRGWRQAREDHA